ncbi:helix-turn-helix transcriptional regulator [Pseudoflavonifractor phocaeensis]|uniref:helix-turn-helix domain-containing protein n=1 Tax=Pseudoflavonifractor phocaeensis TaxID=1870988 RepID=UPI00313C92B8
MVSVPISYEKLIKIFDERGITSYTIKKNNVIGQASLKKIREGGHIDTRTIESLCRYLNCQPGDLMEYVPENE